MSHCAVCGHCFNNQFFHERRGGDAVRFADFDDSPALLRFAPGLGTAMFCDAHVAMARGLAHLPAQLAIQQMQRELRVNAIIHAACKPHPELILNEIGENLSKVFGIIRHATGLNPEDARELISHLPARIAEGWPQQFEYWRCKLIEAGARVSIDWDWN